MNIERTITVGVISQLLSIIFFFVPFFRTLAMNFQSGSREYSSEVCFDEFFHGKIAPRTKLISHDFSPSNHNERWHPKIAATEMEKSRMLETPSNVRSVPIAIPVKRIPQNLKLFLFIFHRSQLLENNFCFHPSRFHSEHEIRFRE